MTFFFFFDKFSLLINKFKLVMKNISIKKISVILILIFLPALSFAEEGGIGDVLATLQELLGSLYLIILALVGIVFA